MSRSRRYSLRVTIATLVVALLLATVAGVLVIAFFIRARTIETTAETLQGEISTRITERVVERFRPLAGILMEYASSVEHGMLGLDDQTLAARFTQRIRFEDRVEWLAFIRADGSAVGAVGKPDGVQVIWRQPEPGGEVRVEMWRPDGTRESSPPVDLTQLQQVPWFRMAAESEAPIWTPPYVRPYDGSIGRASAVAARIDGDLVGVFGLGFSVEFMRAYLESLDVGRTGGVFGVHPQTGAVLSYPSDEALERMGPAVTSAVADLEGGLAGLVPGELTSIPVSHAGVAYRVGLSLQHPDGLPAWIHAIVVPESELVGYFGGYLVIGLLAIAALLLVAVLLAQLLARRVARSLRTIATDLERVGGFDLTDRDSPDSLIHEVAVVAESTKRMKASLRSFGRYVPTDLVRELLRQGHEAELGGVERELTLFFSDIEGFTGLSEGMSPTAVVEALGDYLEVLTGVVREQGGTIDKFIGDGVLAFFNAPRDDAKHVVHACSAALGLQQRLAEETPRWNALGRPALRTRVGLHTDEVVVGNIGTRDRFAYTVIGDGVNFAARLESLNKVYGTWILASESVVNGSEERFVWRRVDRTTVAGRSAGGDVFELLGEEGRVDAAVLEARNAYEHGLGLYFERAFDEAAAAFSEAARLRPGDRAAGVLERRCEAYATEPPPIDWNGVFVQTRK